MSKIVTEGHRDAGIYGLTDLRIVIDIRTFRDFREEFPIELGSSCTGSEAPTVAPGPKKNDRKRTADSIATDANTADPRPPACPDTLPPAAQRLRSKEPMDGAGTAEASDASAQSLDGLNDTSGSAPAEAMELDEAVE